MRKDKFEKDKIEKEKLKKNKFEKETYTEETFENKKRLGIYIHIPFCLKKCFYCDFLSAPAKTEEMEQYFLALDKEISGYDKLASRYSVQSIFFGGGTPTLPSGEQIVPILEKLRKIFFVEEEAEITIECNPETADQKKLWMYKEVGINRISFGLQSVHENELKKLGRVHTYQKFLESFFAAREIGFQNCNVDLMFGLPEQTLADWKDTIQTVSALKPEHISAYSLSVEEGTPYFSQMEEGSLFLPEEEEERNMYQETVHWLKEAGYQRYEISNYAKKGYECRHNLIYWSGQEYLGLGLGASSYLDGVRFRTTSDLKEYQKNGANLDRIHIETERLTTANQMEEFMFLGLRRMAGVSKKEFWRKFGRSVEAVYGEIIKKWKQNGGLEEDIDRIWLTEWGIDISNVVLADFLLD